MAQEQSNAHGVQSLNTHGLSDMESSSYGKPSVLRDGGGGGGGGYMMTWLKSMQGQTRGQDGSEKDCKKNWELQGTEPRVGAEIPLLVQSLPSNSHLCTDWEIWA